MCNDQLPLSYTESQEVVCGVPARFSETPAVSLATECTLIIFTLISSINVENLV